MKLTLIVMLAGCGSAGGDAVDLATDDLNRLGELQPDMAGDAADVDMATVGGDLASPADLAQRGDMAMAVDLNEPVADMIAPYLSCVHESCATYCPFPKEIGCIGGALCVNIGYACRTYSDCCGSGSIQTTCGPRGTCCSAPTGGVCYKDSDCCSATAPQHCIGVTTTDAGFLQNGNCQ